MHSDIPWFVHAGIKDMIPSVDQSGNYEGFDSLVEKANSWLREQKEAVVLNLQSVLIHKAIGARQMLFTCCVILCWKNYTRRMTGAKQCRKIHVVKKTIYIDLHYVIATRCWVSYVLYWPDKLLQTPGLSLHRKHTTDLYDLRWRLCCSATTYWVVNSIAHQLIESRQITSDLIS